MLKKKKKKPKKKKRIMLSEKSQFQKVTIGVVPFIYLSWNKIIEIEKRLVVARDQGAEEWEGKWVWL